LYELSGAKVQGINLAYFSLSSLLFLASTFFWALAWIYVMKAPTRKALIIHLRSLAGVFAPMGLGADMLRSFWASKEKGMKPDRALACSLIVKFFKFILMFLLLLFSVIALSSRSYDFPQYVFIFISMLFSALIGLLIIILLRSRKTIAFIHHFIRKLFLWRFHEELNLNFDRLRLRDIAFIIIVLMLSVVFEIGAAWAAFLSVSQELPLLHIIIFSSVASSLALITVSPQGLGFVEAGSYFLLSMGYFSLSRVVIGNVLIVWNIVRLWIPSIVGLFASLVKRSDR